MTDALTPDLPVFVGGSVAAIAWFAALLVWWVAPAGSPAVALAYAFALLGLAFLVLGVVLGVVVRWRRR